MSQQTLASPAILTMPQRRARRRRRVGRYILALLLGVVGILFFVGVLGGNVRVVEEGRVYRSAQLTGSSVQVRSAQMLGNDLDNVLQRHHIRTVINLRGAAPDANWYLDEKTACASRGVAHRDITLSAVRLPPPRELRKLLAIFDKADYPVLFHCHGGADRSGLAGTLYLHLYRNVPLNEALDRQLTWRYGHIRFGQARAMSDFFDLYFATANGKDLRTWIDQTYPALYAARVPKEEQPDEAHSKVTTTDSSRTPSAPTTPQERLASLQDNSKQELKRAAKDAIKAFFENGGGAQAVGGTLLANLQDQRIAESSGLAASRLNPGILWTHNDSGDGPYLFAIDRKGRTIARVEVKGARAVDWEDLALGPGPNGKPALYIGDFGDNGKGRSDCTLYRVPEPKLNPTRTGQELAITGVEAFPFRYADGPHDAETLLVHPRTGATRIVAKDGSGVQDVYAFPTPLRAGAVLRRTATLQLTESKLAGTRYGDRERMATGGAISPDGQKITVRTYLMGYEWTVAAGQSLDEALKGKPRSFLLPLSRQGESVTYRADGKALLLTSEQLPAPLYEIPL